MILILLLIISLLFSVLIRISFFEFVEAISLYMHNTCLHQLPVNAAAAAELRALVCAENFSTLADSGLYVSSGLIHLFVVSGAHLLLLEKMLSNFVGTKTLLLFLTAYALACGMNPPVTRSLFAFALGAWLSSKNIKWPPHLKILLVGLCTLLFNSEWILSFSLQLSWLAAFLVSACVAFFSGSTPLFRQFLFFVAMLPTLVFFQVPRPLVILLNLFFAPLLELVLFPLGLLVAAFNFLHPIFDSIILILRLTLQKMELDPQLQLRDLPGWLITFNWGLILLLHMVSHLAAVSKAKRHL